MANKDTDILTDQEKKRFLLHLSSRGQKTPSNWKLVHSEICGNDEMDFDVGGLVSKFEAQSRKKKFETEIVSSPDEDSSLDRGLIKVRYRYVIHPDYSSEPLIKSNTREFCEDIISADKIYRREDINIMSFRGVNKISSRNYSIFKLRGHWNCRHAWQREIYLVTDSDTDVEDSRIVEKKTVMKNEKKTFKEKFDDWFKSLKGEKPTKTEIVEVHKTLMGNQKFVDAKVGENTLRVDSDEIVEGASVSWVNEDGTLMDVEDGEIILEDEGKWLVIEGGVIKSVLDKQPDEEEEEMSAELSEIKKTLSDLTATVAKMAEDPNKTKEEKDESSDELKEIQTKLSELTETVKNLPAFSAEKTKQKFKKNEEKTKKKTGGTMLERIAGVSN